MEFKFETREGRKGKPDYVAHFEDMECSLNSYGFRYATFRRDGMENEMKVALLDLRVELIDLHRWIGGDVRFIKLWRGVSLADRQSFEYDVIFALFDLSGMMKIKEFLASNRCQFLFEALDALRQYQAKSEETRKQAEQLKKEIEVELPALMSLRTLFSKESSDCEDPDSSD